MPEGRTPRGLLLIEFFLLTSIILLLISYVSGNRFLLFGQVMSGLARHVTFWMLLTANITLFVLLIKQKALAKYFLVGMSVFGFLTDASTYVRFAISAPETLPWRITLVYLLFISQSLLLLIYTIYAWNHFNTRELLDKDRTFSISYCGVWTLLLVYIGFNLLGST